LDIDHRSTTSTSTKDTTTSTTNHHVFLIKPWFNALEQPHLHRQPIIESFTRLSGTQLQLDTHRLPTLQLINDAPSEQRAPKRLCQRR
jgi:hypothetical protein